MSEQKNVIVIMLDSLQFNYVGAYGNDWIKTPNLDRFAKEGVLFENAYTEGLPTVPCRRAMHTGRYTLPYAGWVALSKEDTTIADLCWGRPIDTALIHDNPQYRLPKFGYTRGFDKTWFLHGHESDHHFYEKDELIHLSVDQFHEDEAIRKFEKKNSKAEVDALLHETECYLKHRQYWKHEEDQNVAHVMKEAVSYLEKIDRNKSFFLWVDSFDPHEPWDPPSVYDPDLPCPYDPDYKGKDQFLPIIADVNDIYTEAEMHHIRMLYAEKVTMCDRWVGHLLDNVRRLGLEDDTLVMIVSDHGEPMGNGEHGHGIMRKCRPWPYEELVHVPYLMRGPGLPKGKRETSYVQSCDIAPTVTDWLGIGVHPEMQGKSLVPLMRGEVDKVRDFAIAGYHKYSWSIITDDYSYIHWVKKDNDMNVLETMDGMYGEQNEFVDHLDPDVLRAAGIDYDGLNASRSGEDGEEDDKGFKNEALEKHRKEATLDGEDQWTCTPGSVAEVPETDELYCRKTDPFQLNNIIDKEPELAKKMFEDLRLFMTELRAS